MTSTFVLDRAGLLLADLFRYHVPAAVQKYVDYITPGLKMLAGKPTERRRALHTEHLEKRGFRSNSNQNFSPPLLKGPFSIPDGLANFTLPSKLDICTQAILPECIATMYNITKGTLKNPNNMMGIL